VIDKYEPVTIIGGDRESIEELKRVYGLRDVRWHEPPMGLKLKPGAIVRAAAFAAAQPSRFTFICVGAPQQEMIAYAIAQRGDARGVGLCVGAALDFLTGSAKRAPKWMQNMGLEWLHRLAERAGPFVEALFGDRPQSVFVVRRVACFDRGLKFGLAFFVDRIIAQRERS
jgi:N-acetylglucosaminyldiphosphoundecaprenol N-acetyl-beta-D-mannosaminyltransferase